MKKYELARVMKPGILTTFQDMGRYGYQQFGIPVSGAMDTFAFQVANILVGNSRNEAAMEVTLIGPSIEAKATITLAITGADLSPTLNQKPAPMWKSFSLKPGDVLSFGKRCSGMRAYIAVAGGFTITTYFGSKSTDQNSGLGMELEKNTILYGVKTPRKDGVSIDKKLLPSYTNEVKVGVVEGPHTTTFSEQARNTFFTNTYTVGPNSNRMGYRLKSEQSVKPNEEGIWSDPVPFGGIQVPGNGEPIILMADRQTTGGYPRLGTVMSSDLPKIAQLAPNDTIHFYPISVTEAQKTARDTEAVLHKLETFYRGGT
ncbi:biotin-dependent carboxyltransferase family protein [Virgibacillus sp. DJP39]|uniref:5-oxoprolinase subunit C family protein n=1 Tax=Virgibacillus sp. DJP39 TaxID=3409790 RepID=UPI003BB58B38